MPAHVQLGQTDLMVSPLSYGTSRLGWTIDARQSETLLDTFLGLGGNFLDTAASYGDYGADNPRGLAERTIGTWLRKQRRADIVLGSKGGAVDPRDPQKRNRANPEDVTADLMGSLARLGVAQIDLYWMHADNEAVPVGEIIDMLAEHRAKGRIRHYGASNWTPARIREANAYARKAGKPGFAASETFWSLALPNAEVADRHGYILHYESDPGFARLHAEGLPFLAYSALGASYFSRVAGGRAPTQIAQGRHAHPANARRLAAIEAVAAAHRASLTEVVLSYLLSQPLQTIPIFATSSSEHLRECMGAARLHLDAAECARLACH